MRLETGRGKQSAEGSMEKVGFRRQKAEGRRKKEGRRQKAEVRRMQNEKEEG